MKHLLLLALLVGPLPLATVGCKTAEVQTVKTLEFVGVSAKLTIDTAAILLSEGKISVSKFQNIAAFYDTKFQPAFRIALLAVEGNNQKPASLQLMALASELSLLLSTK